MTAPFPFGITVTVQRSTADRFGDRSYSDHHTVAGCALAPRVGSGAASSEEMDRRDTVTIGRTLYAPFGADVGPTDRIVLPGGDEYQVVGEPGPWSSPFTGWSPGVEIALQRVEG